jgi:DNA mismatch endonuclease (patch repair protein)
MRIVLSGKAVRPDIVFTRQRLAVFVDSCFWHRCPDHGTLPAKDSGWWSAKLADNVQRDAQVDDLLIRHGWTVIRAWEHEPTAETVERVRRAALANKR